MSLYTALDMLMTHATASVDGRSRYHMAPLYLNHHLFSKFFIRAHGTGDPDVRTQRERGPLLANGEIGSSTINRYYRTTPLTFTTPVVGSSSASLYNAIMSDTREKLVADRPPSLPAGITYVAPS